MWSEGSASFPARFSAQSTQEVPHQRDAIGKHRRAALDADAILSMEADAAILLHEQDEVAGVERRMLDELQRRALRPGVDLGDAQRLCGEAQAMAREQRLRGIRCRTEPVDQFLLDRVDLLR